MLLWHVWEIGFVVRFRAGFLTTSKYTEIYETEANLVRGNSIPVDHPVISVNAGILMYPYVVCVSPLSWVCCDAP